MLKVNKVCFDARLVLETSGKFSGIVRTDNIRHTHFSRNLKIAEYPQSLEPHYHLVAFIMKSSVWANVLEEGQETSQTTTSTRQENETWRQEEDQKSDQIKMILELIKENPQISRSEISHKTGLHSSSVKRRLKMLVDKVLFYV